MTQRADSARDASACVVSTYVTVHSLTLALRMAGGKPGICFRVTAHSQSKETADEQSAKRPAPRVEGARQDISAARTNLAAHNLALTAQIGAINERLSHIDLRIAAMEPHQKGSGVRAAVTGVSEIARTAILG